MKNTVVAAALFSAALSNAQPLTESPGPSSRRTPIAITEIMYKPADRADSRNTEFIELYNSNPWPEDISGFRLAGEVQFTFPPQTRVNGQSYVLVAAAPGDLQAVYGVAGAFGPYTNSLKTSGVLHLLDEQGTRLLEIEYQRATPWPMGADGTGHSIVLARPSHGEGNGQAWERSELTGGSPGSADVLQIGPLRNVMINEVLAHTDAPNLDTIELYNHSNTAVDLSGCILSDDPEENKFIIPAGTVIPARGFIFFTETVLGFALNAAGETVYFKNPGASVLDALRFDAQENGVSFGRYPDGAREWYRLRTASFGNANAPPRVSPVGLNEIMYQPLSGLDDDQYVELFNHGTNAVNLGGWKFNAGISFTFPPDTVLAPNGYLVVARNLSRLLPRYPHLNSANTVGNFSGRLSGSGERVALTMPQVILSTSSGGGAASNIVDVVVDEVTYGSAGRWGRWSDGGGSSLELMDARADKRLAANWADSDETAKAPWATIEATGVLENGTASLAQIGLLEAGECLVDDIEVRPLFGGSNYAGNPGFESGTVNWSFWGSHSRSSLAPNAGYPAGGNALHMRASDSIWTGRNAAHVTLTTSMAPGQSVRLRFKARWLRGCPEPLLRLHNNLVEATGVLPVPANLGSPGLPNSRALTNAGPAIYSVTHFPTLPTAFQQTIVTARVSDPDGVSSLTLNYRVDPSTTTTAVTMRDDGLAGDAVAGDGLFSATIPGQSSKKVVAFTLTATDATGVSSRFPELLNDNAPARECVVVFGDPTPPSAFGAYHLWLTSANVNRWQALGALSNEDIDGTLVYGNRVIYNMSGRYSGSPWHQAYDSPMGNRACHYIWAMPKDDRLLGASSFNKIHWPGNDIQFDSSTFNSDDSTIQREQAANLLLRGLGVPWINRRYVAVYVNGGRRGTLMEDALRPSSSVPDAYFPDDTGGQLFKLQPWYELGNGTGPDFSNRSWCYLALYMTAGGEWKTGRYRWHWLLRETTDSWSNFTNVYTLVTAANPPGSSNLGQVLENVADMENWLRVVAANHAAGNWDCFGFESGQNLYGWVSPQHRWTLFMFDFSISLGNRLSRSPGSGLFVTIDPAWQRILANAKFRRMYWRAFKDLIDGPMRPEIMNPFVDAKYSAFVADGLSVSSPTGIKSWVADARSSIAAQLARVDAASFTVSGAGITPAQNAATITGNAPIEVVTVEVDGKTFTPLWTSTTGWTLTVPALEGTNTWTVIAYNRLGQRIGGTNIVTVVNTFTPDSPVGNVILNEIMFNPAAPGGQFVELFNRSATTMFDLSGWRLNGLSYTFPPGTILAPQQYLVLAESRVVFASTYGALVPVFDQFAGRLQAGGETLSLIHPGIAPELDLVVDRVRYEPNAPWPTSAATRPGTSLQLLNSAQDNSRVASWGARSNAAPTALATPGATNSVFAPLVLFPDLWLNEVQVENLTGPADNFGEREPWIELYNSGTNTIQLADFRLGTNYAQLGLWSFPPGAIIAPGQFLVVWCDGQPEQSVGADLHASFRLNPGGGSIALWRSAGTLQLMDYLNYPALHTTHSYGAVPDGQPFYRQALYLPTPGGANSAGLPPIEIRINEWMAENSGFLLNPATGSHDDWFELYNPADSPADLSGYYLTDALDNPFRFRIPAGYQVPAHGFLLVWADDATSANGTSSPDLHVPFKLDKAGEAIGLFTPDGAVIDAVAFGAQTGNHTEGRFPDGGGLRLFMPGPSPGAPNILPPTSIPPVLAGASMQDADTFVMVVETVPGHSYRVEYKDALTDPVWLRLGPDHFATGSTLTIRDDAGTSRRYYRIVRAD